jgi:hypothetical protein
MLSVAAPAFGADSSVDALTPVVECGEGWMRVEGNTYTKDTLSDRINGEAELYLPYGFELLVFARYQRRDGPELAMEADVYKMGSVLDAFGVYAGYRRADDIRVAIGAEGTMSSSQLLFYQDRYFVRLQALGAARLDREVIIACGSALSQNFPPRTGRPGELDALMIPPAVRGTERYIAQSLLGYRFLRRGLAADAMLGGETVRMFLVPEDSHDAGLTAFHQYRAYLQTSGQTITVKEAPDRLLMSAVDPLYGKVVVARWGRYLIGIIGSQDPAAATRLIEEVRTRLAEGARG